MRNDQLHPNSGKTKSDFHAIYRGSNFAGLAARG